MVYRLTRSALDDVDEITTSLAEHSGWQRSMRFEESIFQAFERVAKTPGIGHRRDDLGRSDFAFYPDGPYFVVYRQKAEMIVIHAVLHSARDLALLIAKR